MRFYNPDTTPTERIDSEILFPKAGPIMATQRCLKLGLVPSVTSVLKTLREEHIERFLMYEAVKAYQTHGNAWAAVESMTNRESTESKFGDRVHEAIHQILSGKGTKDEKALRYGAPLLEWLRETKTKVLMSEVQMACRKTGAGGTIDLYLQAENGERIVADIKVVKIRTRFETGPSLSYKCQLAAYSKMLRLKGEDPRRSISLYLASPFGDMTEPKLFKFEHTRGYEKEFEAALELWHATYGLESEYPKDSLDQERKSSKEEFNPKSFRE